MTDEVRNVCVCRDTCRHIQERWICRLLVVAKEQLFGLLSDSSFFFFTLLLRYLYWITFEITRFEKSLILTRIIAVRIKNWIKKSFGFGQEGKSRFCHVETAVRLLIKHFQDSFIGSAMWASTYYSNHFRLKVAWQNIILIL